MYCFTCSTVTKSLPSVTVRKAVSSASCVSPSLYCCRTMVTKSSSAMLSSASAPFGLADLVKASSSSCSDSSKPIPLSAPENSSRLSWPLVCLSKWPNALVISSYCSCEMATCARASCASMNECLSRITFSSCEMYVSSEVIVWRVYGLSSSALSSSLSLMDETVRSCAARVSRAFDDMWLSKAVSICLPLAMEAESSGKMGVAGATSSRDCFWRATKSRTSSAAAAKSRLSASIAFCVASAACRSACRSS
mmetsp:Transcript_11667/g.25044  ORF Transcript_11667/g.25044 Transcript_11667/m.25044 type:complete len:251 (+) Transcript_11667:976-1728(+)